MSVTVRQLAELVRGSVAGDADQLIHAARALSEAQSGDITFVDSDKHAQQLYHSTASAAVAPFSVPVNGKPLIQVQDPLMAFAAIVRFLQNKPELKPDGIDPRSCVHPSAVIGDEPTIMPLAVVGEGTVVGKRCRIHPGAVVGRNCKIGDDVVLYSNVVVYDDCVLGDRVVIHANSVIGADGFGYRFQQGKHVKVPQLGNVEIGCDVEIGACTAIDRGTFQATRVGEGTKIDNFVQIAHNCQIGKHNLLVSQVGIAGSCSTGQFVVLAGQVGIADHIHIGDGAVVGAKSGVTKDVPPGQRTLGAPATPERDQKRILMSLEKLPEMRKDLRRIKQQLGLVDEEAA